MVDVFFEYPSLPGGIDTQGSLVFVEFILCKIEWAVAHCES